MANISKGRARHDTPILKTDDLSQPVSAPCHVRTAKTWELIKAHSETGLTVQQIAEKMSISENTIANAARNHSFEIRDEDGPINGSSYIRKHLEYQPPKPEPLPNPKVEAPKPEPEPEPPKSEPKPKHEPELKPQPLPEPVYDSVNHPAHYMLPGGGETIDVIEDVCGEGVDEYYRGNIIKYICRYKEKGGAESLKKARWYLNRLIMLQEQREELEAEAK